MTSLTKPVVPGVPGVAASVITLPTAAKPVKPSVVQVVESIFDHQLKHSVTQIEVCPGNLGQVVDQSIEALVNTGLVYDRGGVLVGIDRDNSVHQLNASTIKFALAKIVTYAKITYVKGQIVTETIDVPKYVGETIAAMTAWVGMPRIDAIADHPFLNVNNKLIESGHSATTKTFGRFDDAKFSIPANPSKEDAAAALLDFRRILQTFEFEVAGDEAASLAAMLTAVSRPALATAPLTLIDAPMSGSGKGYLGGLMAKLAHNGTHGAKQLPDDHNEVHKVIMSALMAAKPVVFFDELAMSDIDCPAIRTLATAEIYSGRLLGVMKDVEVSTKTFVECTGNNVSPTADTARRMLHIRLNPMCENPSSRQFSYDAEADMSANRNHFVSLLLTIQRAFLLAHKRGETVKPEQAIGGFKDWDLMCRQPIIWLTGIDPCERMLTTMKSNPAKNDLLTVLAAWKVAFGDTPTKTGDALRDDVFRMTCEETIKRKPGSQISPISLGMWIKKHKGQVIDKSYFDEDASVNGVQYWAVKSV